jgi:hypothetical protein
MQATIVRHRFYRVQNVQYSVERVLRPLPPPPKRKVLLLDFDGVVVNSEYANAYVYDRILDYMQKVTGIFDKASVTKLNKELYTTYGHTLIGLQQMGYVVDIHDFNQYVYGESKKNSRLALTQSETFDMCSLMMQCVAHDFDLMLFSNAHNDWLTTFVQWNPTLFDLQDNIITKHGVLKPTKESYTITDKYLRNKSYTDIYFVDDKSDNIHAAPNTWNKVIFEANTMKLKNIPKMFTYTE